MKKAVASIVCVRPSCTICSCASMVEAVWSWTPGKSMPTSIAIQPMTASMHTRPCFSSDSRR